MLSSDIQQPVKTIDLESKENNTVAKVYSTKNRAISRCYKRVPMGLTVN